MRRLLLDTHVLLWWLADDPQLGRKARTLVKDARNTVMVSAASAWEISMKKAMRKLEAPEGLSNLIEDEGFESLPITFFHGEQAGALPLLHRDPFDRMLVAQAQAEGHSMSLMRTTVSNSTVSRPLMRDHRSIASMPRRDQIANLAIETQ